MNKTTLLLLTLPLVTACASEPPAPQLQREHTAITTQRLEPYECGTITRLHTLGGVFLASQPAPEDLAQAKQGGVRTVVNLRHDAELDFDERAVVEDLGLAYVHVPWNGPEELTDQVFERLREVLRTAERPLLLHISSSNRVGAVWIPNRVLDEGVPLEEAVAEARTIGLKSPAYEELARAHVRRHGG